MNIVVDASAAVRAQTTEESALWLQSQLSESVLTFAPDLFQAEVTNALLKYVRAGQMTLDQAQAHLKVCLAIPEHYASDSDLAPRALSLAERTNCSAYDMFYVALAHENAAKLVTADRKLAQIARAVGVIALEAPAMRNS